MSDRIQQLIKEQFDSLPPIIQETITNSHWEDKLRVIVEKHKLHIDQGTDIENQTLLTMLGFEDSEDYVKNLESHADLSTEQAIQVAKDVEEQIFSLIRNKLISDIDGEDEIDEYEPPIVQPRTVREPSEPKRPLEEKLSRADILKDIENPPPSPVSVRRRNFDENENKPSSNEVSGGIYTSASMKDFAKEDEAVDDSMTKEIDSTVPNTMETPKAVGESVLEDERNADSAPKQTTESETTPHTSNPPSNLPVGDIDEVPPHGHDHSGLKETFAKIPETSNTAKVVGSTDATKFADTSNTPTNNTSSQMKADAKNELPDLMPMPEVTIPEKDAVAEMKKSMEEPERSAISFTPKPAVQRPQNIIEDKFKDTVISSKETLVGGNVVEGSPVLNEAPSIKPDPYREQF